MDDRTDDPTVVTGGDNTTAFVDGGDLEPRALLRRLGELWRQLDPDAVVTVHSRHPGVEPALEQWCSEHRDVDLFAAFTEGSGTTFTLRGIASS